MVKIIDLTPEGQGPEFEAWQRFLEEQVGVGALDVRPRALYDPASREG